MNSSPTSHFTVNTSDTCLDLNDNDDFLAGSIVAFLSIIPNIFLLFVFAAAREKDKALPMGVVHLGILAILDILYGVVDIFADFPFTNTISEKTVDCYAFTIFEGLVRTIIPFVLITNRFFTAYMTIMRLLCVSASVGRGMKLLRLTEKHHIRNSLLIGVLTPFLLLIFIFFIIDTNDGDGLDWNVRLSVYWLIITFALSLVTVVITCAAAGLLYHRRRKAVATTPAAKETETLVILVAITFTICHLPFFVLFVEIFTDCFCDDVPRLIEGSVSSKAHDVAFSINAAANFFICFATSSAFRRNFWRMFRSRGQQDGDAAVVATPSVNFMNQSDRRFVAWVEIDAANLTPLEDFARNLVDTTAE